MTPQSLLHSPLGHFTLTKFSLALPVEPVHWPGERGYVPRTFAELHGAAILGNLFQGSKIAANVEIQICVRFYFRDVYRHPPIFLVKI